jgi:PAS domain S-box-containing protein
MAGKIKTNHLVEDLDSLKSVVSGATSLPRPAKRSAASKRRLLSALQRQVLDRGPAICLLAEDGELLYENAAFQRIKRPLAAAGALPGNRKTDGNAGQGPAACDTKVTIEIDHQREHYLCRQQVLTDGPTEARAHVFEPVSREKSSLTEIIRLRGKLEDVTRLVSDWVWETDRDLKFSALSPRTTKVLGLHPRELLGTALIDLPEPGSKARIENLATNYKTPFRDLEIEVKHSDGSLRRLRLSGLPVYDHLTGAFQGLRGTAEEITSRRKREAALIKSKEAAELANRTKTKFLANMSHELRTPLNAVIGFAEIMERELLGPLGNEQYKSYAEDIHSSAEHLLKLINDILDISKIEADSHQVCREEVDPYEIVDCVCRLIADRCLRSGLTLERSLPEGLPGIFVDERKIKQVLLNLLANAAKFTDKGGRVTISASYYPGQSFDFVVTDNGIGIAPEDMEIAFAPFEQIDSQLNRQCEGTGLGLPLSLGFMRLHDGDLILDSVPSKGTKAIARLPSDCVIKR